jgi:glutaredoxin
LGGITYPLLSDFYPHGHVAQCFGVLRHEGYSERALFVVDKRGIIRYVDVHDIDQQPDNEELFKVLIKLEPGAVVVHKARSAAQTQAAAQPQVASKPAPNADVVLYCTPWCPDCRRAREYFKAKGVQWAEIDITVDRAAAMDVRGWAGGNETTPTINVRGEVIIGFDKEKIEKLLADKQ